ncbi:MAG TPA: protein-glutamine glutaminase family protein [Bacteriovoracaceae bacterium]|nr:protein-glutamine glutaminase family protein [Bacteriovoracaceae bacterium]
MPRFIFIVFTIFCSLPVLAESFIANIHSISEGEETLIKFSNGRVGFMPSDTESLNSLKHFHEETVEVELDSESELVSMARISGSKNKSVLENDFLPQTKLPQTIMTKRENVVSVFNRLNKTYLADSECYNRAHIWAYEEYKKNSIVMNKVFVFFSDAYIKKYNFKWWFHVAPYLLYRRDGALYAGVLDHQFSQGPQSIKSWTDTWIETKNPCKLINRYSEYSLNTLPNECYLMKVDMFFWQPRDMESVEKGGLKKESFLSDEVKHAYTEAFGIK